MKHTHSKPSFARWWRQVCFMPIRHSKWLTDDVKAKLSSQITASEQGHRGEIFVIIENHLPIPIAYRIDCRTRALQLFSQYGVWDTQENTGVLVYINICEHTLEIIADRGINEHVSPTVWQALCDKAISGLAQNKIEDSLSALLKEIGMLLKQYHQSHSHLPIDPNGNELSDTIIHLK